MKLDVCADLEPAKKIERFERPERARQLDRLGEPRANYVSSVGLDI